MPPQLTVSFVPETKLGEESQVEVVASLKLKPVEDSPAHWELPEPQQVRFPTGDVIVVMSEVTKYGNYFSAYDDQRRLCSLKTTGSVHVMFILPSGHEAFAKLSDGKAVLDE